MFRKIEWYQGFWKDTTTIDEITLIETFKNACYTKLTNRTNIYSY